jgi:hypothetical protein
VCSVGDGPGVAAVEQGLQVGGAVLAGGVDAVDLSAGGGVVGEAVDVAEDAADGVDEVLAGQPGQLGREVVVGGPVGDELRGVDLVGLWSCGR